MAPNLWLYFLAALTVIHFAIGMTGATAAMVARRKPFSRPIEVMLIAVLMTATHATSAPGQETADAQLPNATKPANATKTPAPRIGSEQEKPGRNAFDFQVGDWRVENRRMVKPLEEGSAWETFEATIHVEKVLGGIGTMGSFTAPALRRSGTSVTLRIFNGETGLWSIFQLNSRNGGLVNATGHLDVPVVGKFENGIGIFEGDDVIDGIALRCRYIWSDTLTDHPKWRQDFSFDGGKTWKTNWVSTHTSVKK